MVATSPSEPMTACRAGLIVPGETTMVHFILGIVQVIGMSCIFAYAIHIKLRGGHLTQFLVIPAYYVIVLYSIVVGLSIGIYSIVGVHNTSAYAISVKWFLFQLDSMGVTLLLLHNGVGFMAILTRFGAALAWSVATTIIPLVLANQVGMVGYTTSMVVFLVMLLVLHGICAFSPQTYFSRRPALVMLSTCYFLLYSAFTVMYVIAMKLVDGNTIADCTADGILALEDFLQPFIILYALRIDSKFWLGLYTNATSNLNEPLLGIWNIDKDTIQMISESIVQLEKKVVPILPFTELILDTSKFFPGGNARVYKGQYVNTTVAIKILFCIELTPERVIDFCNEATLLNSLQHPNVVKCFGVAVMPPALTLVTEFCDFGSLYGFLHEADFVIKDRNSKSGDRSDSDSKNDRAVVQVQSKSSAGNIFSSIGKRPIPESTPPAATRLDKYEVEYDLTLPLDENHGESMSSMNDKPALSTISSILMGNRLSRKPPQSLSREASKNPMHPSLSHLDIAEVYDHEYAETKQNSSVPTRRKSPQPFPLRPDAPNKEALTEYSREAELLAAATKSSSPRRASGSDTFSSVGSVISSVSTKIRNFPTLQNNRSKRNMSGDTELSSLESGSYGTSFRSSPSRRLSKDYSKGLHGLSGLSAGKVQLRKAEGVSEEVAKLRESTILAQKNRGVGSRAEGRKGVNRNEKNSLGQSNIHNNSPRTSGKPLSGGWVHQNKQNKKELMQNLSSVLQSKEMNYGLGPKGKAQRSGSTGAGLSASTGFNTTYQSSNSLLAQSVHVEHSTGQFMPLSLRFLFCRDCCAGVAFLHRAGFMHCDIKSLNFLVSSDLVTKLSDLGEARLIHPPANTRASLSGKGEEKVDIPVNMNWAAPEVLLGTGCDERSDVYSLACVLSEILCGEVPFDSEEYRNLSLVDFAVHVQEGKRPLLPSYVDDYPWVADILSKAWAFDADERCSAADLLEAFESNL